MGQKVRSGQLEDVQAFIAPTLAGSWLNYDTSVFNAAGYYKDRRGVVHLRGLVKSGSGTIFTLPSGYRPVKEEIIRTCANDAFGQIRIETTGIVKLQVGNSAFVSLDGLKFKAI